MNSGLIKILHGGGGLLVLAGALFQFFEFEFAKYVFAVGTVMLIAVQAYYLNNGRNEGIRLQRIFRIMFLVTLLLGFGVYLMFKGDDRWVVILLLYALVSAFLAFRSGGAQAVK